MKPLDIFLMIAGILMTIVGTLLIVTKSMAEENWHQLGIWFGLGIALIVRSSEAKKTLPLAAAGVGVLALAYQIVVLLASL